MSTEILDYRKIKQLQPAVDLWRRYHPEKAAFAFRSNKPTEARNWQRRARRALGKVVGFQSTAKAALSPRLLERVDKGDYVREKILLRPSRNVLMPVYLLLPKEGERPLPVVLALHGHGYGVKDIVGLWQDGEERNEPEGYHKDFAVALCRRGFAVAAPEISCFGERQTDFSYLDTAIGQNIPKTCAHTAFLAFHLGGSAIGLRVFDSRRLIDYLEGRKDIDTARLGAMGISGGGMHTFYSTCLETRIRACVISGYFSTFKESIHAMNHCPCNYIPGLSQFGEMADLAGLIAPRPFLVESGSYDPIFPRRAVRKGVTRARAIYRVFGLRDGIQTDYFEGRHQISGRLAYDFLFQQLSR